MLVRIRKPYAKSSKYYNPKYERWVTVLDLICLQAETLRKETGEVDKNACQKLADVIILALNELDKKGKSK